MRNWKDQRSNNYDWVLSTQTSTAPWPRGSSRQVCSQHKSRWRTSITSAWEITLYATTLHFLHHSLTVTVYCWKLVNADQFCKQTNLCSALYTSAVNMTLPAFAAERRAAAPCCWCHMHARRVPLLLSAGASLRSTSPARGALSSKPAGVTVIGRWDRETDRRTLDPSTVSYIPCSPHTIPAVSTDHVRLTHN